MAEIAAITCGIIALFIGIDIAADGDTFPGTSFSVLGIAFILIGIYTAAN